MISTLGALFPDAHGSAATVQLSIHTPGVNVSCKVYV